MLGSVILLPRTISLGSLGRLAGLLSVAFLAGCGGADFGGASRNSGFDNGLSGNFSGYADNTPGRQATGVSGKGTYAHFEASFELPNLKGNPFDYAENDIQVSISRPDGQKVQAPAFFDGGSTWRVRYTPDSAGRYVISGVRRNGTPIEPEKLDKREFNVTGSAEAGFVRIDPRDKTRFAFDNGNSYYPLGHDVAWDDVAGLFGKLGKAGENWSRVWMTHWNGANLDWVMNKKLPLGTLDLEVARKWDAIVDAAAKNGVYFQMVLQHHGQYSTRVNPNWGENPWNTQNGGFLSTPDEFFTNPKALALTRAKYRYIIARWGYSPNVLAWELFNEVQYVDAVAHNHTNEVAAWHASMVDFLHKQDPYKHLVTSSSDLDLKEVMARLDYLQPHAYPPDALSMALSLDARKEGRPIFYGEVGPSGDLEAEDGSWLHTALWGSLMSGASGAAQYWTWDNVDKRDLYGHFAAAAAFVRASGFPGRRDLAALPVTVQTAGRGPLTLGPGAMWAWTKQVEYTVLPSGAVEGMGSMPAYLQGQSHAEMFNEARFKVDYPAAGTFTVNIGQSARTGAHVVVSVDGVKAAEKEFAAAGADTPQNVSIQAKVPAGAHTVSVRNTGEDWVVVRRFVLDPYAPAVGAVGRGDKDFAMAWVYRRGSGDEPVKAKLTLPGLEPGTYTATWWDTRAGKAISEGQATCDSARTVTLDAPETASDVAVFVRRDASVTRR